MVTGDDYSDMLSYSRLLPCAASPVEQRKDRRTAKGTRGTNICSRHHDIEQESEEQAQLEMTPTANGR
jgi:hypothetical protein